MRLKAWLAARVSLRLARLPRTASSAQRSLHARAVLLARADVTKIILFQWVQNVGARIHVPPVCMCAGPSGLTVMVGPPRGAAMTTEQRKMLAQQKTTQARQALGAGQAPRPDGPYQPADPKRHRVEP